MCNITFKIDLFLLFHGSKPGSLPREKSSRNSDGKKFKERKTNAMFFAIHKLHNEPNIKFEVKLKNNQQKQFCFQF